MMTQLVRIGFRPKFGRGGSATIGPRSYRLRYVDAQSFQQAYHEIFMRQVYFFTANHDSPLIVDCGANIGVATLYFKTLYPGSMIEAFEPDPLTFAILKENVTRNSIEGVSLHQIALWDSEGDLDLYVDKLSQGRLSMSAFRGRMGDHETKITVPARPLAGFLGERIVDFLKVDVEGSEDRLLWNLINEGKIGNVRQMAIEYHHPVAERSSRLGSFLAALEKEGFNCNLYADLRPRPLRDPKHDVLICASRN